jgi:hypothetical protein
MAITMISLKVDYASQNDIDISALGAASTGTWYRDGEVAEVWHLSSQRQRAEFLWGRKEV